MTNLMNSFNRKNIIFNSSLLFVIASMLEMTLHESGHFIAAIFCHAKDVTLFHNNISDSVDGLSLVKVIFIKAAGPFVSLMIGFVFHFICSRQSKRNLLFLFNLYLTIFGYIGFFGYLIIAPFFTDGDTGYICYALNFPFWLTISIAAAGAGILYLLMLKLTKYFVEMGTKEIVTTKELRIPFIHSLILFPLLIGIIITTLLNFPIPVFVSLIAPVCSPFTIMWTYGHALSKNYPTEKTNRDIHSIDKINVVWIIIFVLIILLNRFLVHGISVN
jgi:hypothetical protein